MDANVCLLVFIPEIQLDVSADIHGSQRKNALLTNATSSLTFVGYVLTTIGCNDIKFGTDLLECNKS